MNKRWMVVTTLALASLAAGSARAEVEYRGWGPRVGLASDPDQFLAGVHFDLGEFAKNVAFRPDVVVGFGDDVTAIVGSAPVWYMFNVDADVRPYAGAALAVGWWDVDDDGPGDDDSDVEIGLQVGGGGEWKLESGNRFNAELRVDFVDVWEFAVFAGWTF